MDIEDDIAGLKMRTTALERELAEARAHNSVQESETGGYTRNTGGRNTTQSVSKTNKQNSRRFHPKIILTNFITSLYKCQSG
jgi:hypothetical protein